MINFEGVNTQHMNPLRKQQYNAGLPAVALPPPPAPPTAPASGAPGASPLSQAMSIVASVLPKAPAPVPAPNPVPVMPQPNVPAPNPVPVMPQPVPAPVPAPNPVPVMPQPNVPAPNPVPVMPQPSPNIPEPNPTPLPVPVPSESPEEQQAQAWAQQYGGRRLTPAEVANLRMLYQLAGGGSAGMEAVHANIRSFARNMPGPNVPQPNPLPVMPNPDGNIPAPNPLPVMPQPETAEEQQAQSWAMQYGGRRLQPGEIANLKNLYLQSGGGQAGMHAVHNSIRDYAARGGK